MDRTSHAVQAGGNVQDTAPGRPPSSRERSRSRERGLGTDETVSNDVIDDTDDDTPIMPNNRQEVKRYFLIITKAMS